MTRHGPGKHPEKPSNRSGYQFGKYWTLWRTEPYRVSAVLWWPINWVIMLAALSLLALGYFVMQWEKFTELRNEE